MKNTLLQFCISILVVLFFGCSTSSDGNGNSTTTVVPLPPTNLIGVVGSTTQINLSWTDNSTNETGFKIQRRTGSSIYTIVGTVNSDVLTFSDTGLTPGTTYIYRVYSYNSVGDSPTYSNEVTVTTNSTIALSTLSTTTVTAITSSTAISGGTISSDGGAAITARGICWSSSPSPTINLITKTNNGNGIGTFSSNISGLSASSTYYVRAYATNSVGTAYGNQVTISTNAAITLPTISTTSVTSITQTTSTSGGNITDDGGSSITARGVCWSFNTNPTINLQSRTNNGVGSGLFSSSIVGLIANTTYYIRAYATNSFGTAYGNELIFNTLENTNPEYIDGPNVTDIDGNIYQSVNNCGLIIIKSNLNVSKYSDGTPIPQVTDPTQWKNLTTGAWCYNNNPTENTTTYGKLYNWYAVAGIYNAASASNPALRKKLAPTGWHVLSDVEWTQLTNCLGGETVAGSKLKSTGTIQAGTGLWCIPNTAANNASGFTALPGGYRLFGGTFSPYGCNGFWWSISESSTAGAWQRQINYNSSNVIREAYTKKDGNSVRCIKD